MTTFTPGQKLALKHLNARHNVFLTGFAGTGKSFLIKHFIKDLDRKTFPVLASTGAAAVLIGGRTFHSFFGLGIMEGGIEATVDRACNDRRVKSRIKKIDGFILDEVSMIPGTALKAADLICQTIRQKRLPWGGIRVIAVGDFAQLPPITQNSRIKDWAFLTNTWEFSAFSSILLKDVVRTHDSNFVDVLNDVRYGIVTERVSQYLNQKIEPFIEEYNGTCLFPLRTKTESYNIKRLNEIDTRQVDIPTDYFGQKTFIDILKKSAPIPEILSIKESALVMIRVNDPQYRFINGSTGFIEDIQENAISIRLKNGRLVDVAKASFSLLSAEGKEVAVAVNFPINLAYATTIHKSQGCTLSDVMLDLTRLWEPGQAYVALSRLETGGGLKLYGWDQRSILADPDVIKFHNTLETTTDDIT